MAKNIEWYYVDASRSQQGPKTIKELRALWTSQTIKGDTLVWCEGQPGWSAIDTLKDLKEQISMKEKKALPPPLPPTIPPVPTTSTTSKTGKAKKSVTKEAEATKKVNSTINVTTNAPEKKQAASQKATAKKKKKGSVAGMNITNRPKATNGWMEIYTPDGIPYYIHEETNKLTWDKPAELRTKEDEKEDNQDWVFVNDSVEGFVAIRVSSEDANEVVGTSFNGKSVRCKTSEIFKRVNAKSTLLKHEDDLVHMKEVDEASITHCLRQRFLKDLIYTSIGDIIVSINPWKRLPLYTPDIIYKYSRSSGSKLPPHVFDTARNAYRQIREYQNKVSVLISGESGAGKTEATKQILTYLSEVAGGSSNIAAKLLSANPVLEAFGNAKTIRNNNSSRFGKYMQVYFDVGSRIVSCDIKNYLLESSRLVIQSEGERSFHIFYQLCAGLSMEQRQKLQLDRPATYSYTNQSGCISIDGMDDGKEFEDVQSAMNNLGFQPAEKENIFAVTAAVLHIGNIMFDPIEGENGHQSAISSASEKGVSIVARLLGVESKTLSKVLTSRDITLRGETMTVQLSAEKAANGRDALAKKVYSLMFNWIVARINSSMATAGMENLEASVGILDIFGFEIFETNSFEQLCINFCNEKLQQHFNTHTFKSEEELYVSEGIPFEHIDYKDNQDVLDLLEKKPHGILVLLDDEVAVPKGSDKSFVNKLTKRQKKHPRFHFKPQKKTLFSVEHYAGQVEYNVDDFCEKNKDRLEEDVAWMLSHSSDPLVADIMKLTREMLEQKKKGNSTSTRATRYRTRTQGGQFRLSLNALIKEINTTRPFYVRCIKSNNIKKPGIFNGKMCLEQLRYAGVFEAVEIRMQGYPFRFDHEQFFKRFRCLLDDPPNTKGERDFKSRCEEMVAELSQVDEDLTLCHIGRTKVLYRAKQNAMLELRRANIVRVKSLIIQCAFRGMRGRKLARDIRKFVPILEEAIKTRDKDVLKDAIEKASVMWFQPRIYDSAMYILANLEKEAMIKRQLEQLEQLDPEESYDEFEETIKKVNEIRKHDSGAFQDEVSTRIRVLFEDIQERKEAIKSLNMAAEKVDKQMLQESLERIKAVKVRWGNDICPVEEKKAAMALQRIEKEEKYASDIVQLIEGHGATGTPGYVNIDDLGDVRLEHQLMALAEFGAHAEDAIMALEKGNCMLKLRIALKDAMSSTQQTNGPLWTEVQHCVAHCTEVKIDENNKEIQLIKEDIALRCEIDDTVNKLEEALEKVDEEWLKFGLEQGLMVGLPTNPNRKYQDLYFSAKTLLGRIHEIHEALDRGVKTMKLSVLIKGIDDAEAINWISGPIVQKSIKLRDEIRRTLDFGKRAIENVNIVELKIFLEKCERQNIVLKPQQTKARELLQLPEDQRLQLQLKAALKNEDHHTVTEITLRIKELFFKEHGSQFDLSQFYRLKPRALFAKRYGVTDNNLRKNMLHWTEQPIHTSLLRLESPEIKRLATRYFKNILGYMGDRQYSYPVILAHELITAGIENVELRDELYCQMMKQLSKNPNDASKRRGWNLMALALSSFPPSDELENFLELFLRENNQFRTVRKLHRIVFGGALPETVSVDRISKIAERGHRFSIVDRGDRFSVSS